MFRPVSGSHSLTPSVPNPALSTNHSPGLLSSVIFVDTSCVVVTGFRLLVTGGAVCPSDSYKQNRAYSNVFTFHTLIP